MQRRTKKNPSPRTRVVDANPLEACTRAYVQNLLVSTSLRRLDRTALNRLWDMPLAVEWAETIHCDECATEAKPYAEFPYEHLRPHLQQWARVHGRVTSIPLPRARVARNLRYLQDALELGPADVAVLQVLAAVASDHNMSRLMDSYGPVTMTQVARLICAATGLPEADAQRALAADSRIRSTGLLHVEQGDGYEFTGLVSLKVGLLQLLLGPPLNRQRFLGAYLERAKAPTLTMADFADDVAARTARDLLAAAITERTRGVNVLFYGATGTGKSELARVLARELGVPLFAVASQDESGNSPGFHERTSSLVLAQALSPPGKSLLLFDELEDLFEWSWSHAGPHARSNASKQWLGSMLEENTVPVIWCTNRTDGIDRAYLRRFSYAVEMRPPGARRRAEILRKHAGDALPAADVETLAQRYEASPAQLAAAVRGARLLRGAEPMDRASVEAVLAPVEKLVSGHDARRRPVFLPGAYRLDALNCSQDLAAIAERLSAFKPGDGPGPSICLYGPPGTGKSEYVRYLAHRTGRPLVYRRASDILTMWVGENERKIAAAFAEAERDGAILLFDEADSFLRDRKDASRSWEVTMVNEFLQQLEAFPGIACCTTNLWKDIDEAALRRFVFKLEMRFPSAQQAWDLFGLYFGEALKDADTPAVQRRLAQLSNVSPGDFAAVARRVRALGSVVTADGLVRMLGEEVAVKRVSSRSIGF